MDDIQFWLYLAFAVIYFITRGLKKKQQPPKPANRSESSEEDGNERPTKKPVSFEELLKEFTEGKSTSSQDEVEEVATPETQQRQQERAWIEKKQPEFEEGVTRRFSDEESKRVYEESIKRAQGSLLDEKPDDSFRSKLSRNEAAREKNAFADELVEMLRSPEGSKKAIILAEILNKRY